MRRNLLAAVLFLAALSTGLAADEIVSDDFSGQSDGDQLSSLVNWKFFAGWVKPEDGKIVAENSNKFLRLHGDVFARSSCVLVDKLTYRFKIRATGSEQEIGGLDLRSTAAKSRYDILFAYKYGGVVLAKDVAGKREELAKAVGVVSNLFQDVVVMVERVDQGVKFTVSIDGKKVIEKVDTEDLAFLKESFSVGFFTYNQKTIDIDDVEFTQGK